MHQVKLLRFFLFGDKWGSGVRTHAFNQPTNLDFPRDQCQALCLMDGHSLTQSSQQSWGL